MLPLLSAKYTRTCEVPGKQSHSNKKTFRGTWRIEVQNPASEYLVLYHPCLHAGSISKYFTSVLVPHKFLKFTLALPVPLYYCLSLVLTVPVIAAFLVTKVVG
jgi:hypothetical protein